MKYCREMFLKFPPAPTSPPPPTSPLENVPASQLLDNDSMSTEDSGTRKNGKRSRRRQKFHRNETSPDDSSNWVTDHEASSDSDLSPRRRRIKFRAEQDKIQLAVMMQIYEAQSQEVKDVLKDLYKLHLKQQRYAKRRINRPRLVLAKMSKKNILKPKDNGKKLDCADTNATNVGFLANIKILARLQRRRRHRGKPRSKKNRPKKFPRRRRRRNGKRGNRQGRKRYLRAQRLFEKGIFLAGRKLLDQVWEAVKDPDATATSFCNNNTHGLSKIHKKQIELYERIEEDLHRLDAARHERVQAALERKAKELEKETSTHEGFKNIIEARAAARIEQESLKKQRRAVRKQRALEKKAQKERAKFECLKPVELVS